jgi:preprotein translocase subunit SecF
MMQKSKSMAKAVSHIIWQNKAIAILLALLGIILFISAPNLSLTAGGTAVIGRT